MGFLQDTLGFSLHNARALAYYGTISIPFLIVFTALYKRFLHPYSNIPGPFWASISRAWYIQQINRGDMDKTTKALHKQYGKSLMVWKITKA